MFYNAPDLNVPLPPLSIGSPVWVWDENRRVYNKRPGIGYSGGRPIFREHFRPGKIVGETKLSWIAQNEGRETKLPKKRRVRGVAYSASELDDIVFAADNALQIGDAVRKLQPDMLRKVAELIGYKPTDDMDPPGGQ